ncbi:unnamed protein product [Camellia sinensis]
MILYDSLLVDFPTLFDYQFPTISWVGTEDQNSHSRPFTPSLQRSNPKTTQFEIPLTSPKSQVSSPMSTTLGFQSGFKFKQNQHNPFHAFPRRFYNADRYDVQHFKPRGPRKWYNNPRTVFTVVLLSSGVIITVYFGNLETVPHTNRKHFVLLSRNLEKQIGEAQFKQIKAAFNGKILPAIHPESIRVRLISQDIIGALHRGLRIGEAWNDLGYASVNDSISEIDGIEALVALSESKEGKWYRDDEVLDDKWVQKSRKKGKERGSKPDTGHLEGLNWEVLVVDEPVVNAFCLPGGKIVVFTGLLQHFRTDPEIATIIGHEAGLERGIAAAAGGGWRRVWGLGWWLRRVVKLGVGHAVARHIAEGITKNLWFVMLQLILFQFIMPDLVYTMSTLFLKLPFSRREQSSECVDKSKKTVNHKGNGLPSQPLDVSRRGMVFRNLQPSIIEDTDMKQIYDANVSARSPPKADGEISCRMKKSRGSVWDRLGKPCKENSFVNDKAVDAHAVDIVEKDQEMMEMEADYIGLLLMSSAGYDPRVAPKVYEKLGMITGNSKLRDYLSTHPSGKKRAVLLSQAKVMEEAMAIYREAILGQGVLGFL